MGTKRRWTENPHQIVPPELAAGLWALRHLRGGGLGALLAACRDAGWGVPSLAVAAGMNPGAVAQQILRARRANAVPDVAMHIPRPELLAEEHPAAGPVRRPDPPLSHIAVEHLRELHAEARLVRFNLPADHPYRLASEHLAQDIDALVRQGYRKMRIAGVLGVSQRAVDQRLEQHGLRPPVPSAVHRRSYRVPAARKVA